MNGNSFEIRLYLSKNGVLLKYQKTMVVLNMFTFSEYTVASYVHMDWFN